MADERVVLAGVEHYAAGRGAAYPPTTVAKMAEALRLAESELALLAEDRGDGDPEATLNEIRSLIDFAPPPPR